MNYTMTTPCPKCPFRTDIKPFLTRSRGREIAHALDTGSTFQCHATCEHAESDDGEEDYVVSTPKDQHCAGALILLERMGKPNQMMRICERLGMYDSTKLDMKAPVFKSLAAFWQAQQGRR